MAREVVFTDDLDGSADAKTISYSFDGVDYEIDLAEKNEKELRDFLGKYITASRRAEASAATTDSRTAGTKKRSSAASTKRQDLAEIREWANNNGYKVAERGRVKQEVIDKYDEAHK